MPVMPRATLENGTSAAIRGVRPTIKASTSGTEFRARQTSLSGLQNRPLRPPAFRFSTSWKAVKEKKAAKLRCMTWTSAG